MIPLYMLDTDTCAFIMRGPSENLRQKLIATPMEKQSISVVTLAELLYGVRLSSKPEQNREALGAFVKHVSVFDWPENAAEDYAEIRVHLQKKGQMIGANDLMIAAHARSAGAVLVTNNEREFRRVPGLEVENWL
ncbi:MAG: type II toxin-antitoxin system VapC family toxin [Burkholderiales bacterium]|nr:type II toxin-antitoxin system VapC family toxin [Burkholderiales bacterium]